MYILIKSRTAFVSKNGGQSEKEQPAAVGSAVIYRTGFECASMENPPGLAIHSRVYLFIVFGNIPAGDIILESKYCVISPLTCSHFAVWILSM